MEEVQDLKNKLAQPANEVDALCQQIEALQAQLSIRISHSSESSSLAVTRAGLFQTSTNLWMRYPTLFSDVFSMYMC